MPVKVLLVDDDDAFRSVAAIALKSAGYVVLEATDGQAALELLEQDRPDLIISDLSMPGLDGCALSRQLRASSRLAEIPLLILSAHVEQDGISDWSELPADCCFSKQGSFGRILKRIEELTSHLK